MHVGIDEAWAKVDPNMAKQWGATFIIGYVSQDTSGKNLNIEQVDSIHAAGLAVGLVYEFNPQSALGGDRQGTIDASIAIAHADSLGAPPGTALYCAVDFNTNIGQEATVLAYCEAFRKTCLGVGFRAGVYASYAVCTYLTAHGYNGFLWQTYAWSAGQWVSNAALRQVANGISVGGANVDKDEAELDDWGQWESEFQIDPVSISNTEAMEEDDMYGSVPAGNAFNTDGSWVDMTKAVAIPVPLVGGGSGGWGPRWVWLAANQSCVVRVIDNGSNWNGENVELNGADGGRLVALSSGTTEIYIGYVGSGDGATYLVKGES